MSQSKQKYSYGRNFQSSSQSYKATQVSTSNSPNQVSINLNGKKLASFQKQPSKGMSVISAKLQNTKKEEGKSMVKGERKRTQENQQYRMSAVDMNEQLLRERKQERDGGSLINKKLEEVEKYIYQIIDNQPPSDISKSNLPQNIKTYLPNIRRTIQNLQKFQSEYYGLKKFIEKIVTTKEHIKLENTDFHIRKLTNLINDRREIQHMINGNPVDIARIPAADFTNEGIQLIKKLSNLVKKYAFQQNIRSELSNLLQKKASKDGRPYYNSRVQNMPIQSVYEQIKRISADATKQELGQAERINKELKDSQASLDYRSKLARSQLDQLSRQMEELKQSKFTQINGLKLKISQLQKKMNELRLKNEQLLSNQHSHRKQKDQIQRSIHNTQLSKSQVALHKEKISSLFQENKKLKEKLEGIIVQNKTINDTKSSVELAAKYNIRQCQLIIKTQIKHIQGLEADKTSILSQKDQVVRFLNQKLQQIKLLEAKLNQNDKKSSGVKQNQQRQLQKNDRIFNQYNQLQKRFSSLMLKQEQQRNTWNEQLKKKANLEIGLKNKQTQIIQLAQSNTILQLQNKNSKKQIKELSMQIQKLRSANSQLSIKNQTLSDLNMALKAKEEQIVNLKGTNKSRSAQSQVIEAEAIKLRFQVQQQKKVITYINQNISSKQKQLQTSLEKNNILLRQLNQINQLKRQHETKIVSLQKELSDLNTANYRQQRVLKAKNQQIEELTHTNNNLQQMLGQISDLKCNNSFSVDEKRNGSPSILKQMEDQGHLAQQLKQSLIHQQQLESELKDKDMKISELTALSLERERREESCRAIDELQSQNARLRSSINKIQESSQLINVSLDDYARVNTLYQHQLLLNFYNHKQFLTETIENRYNMRIKHTKLIYCYDTLNKVNFHQYIDNVSSLLLVLKTAAGMFVAAYSEGPFLRRTSDRDGIIFSLTNCKFFTPVQHNRRAITYDEYYIIFGNSQIRLKSLENKIFSNFAINNSYYHSRGEKVTVLLGGGPHDRETEIESYEIYQVLFDDY